MPRRPMIRDSHLPMVDRIRARVAVDQATGCWLWTRHVDADGYGRWTANGRQGLVAHRFAFAAWHGEIPDGFQVDHVCHNRDLTCPGGAACSHRRCVNPEHLEAVTSRINTLRSPKGVTAQKSRQTHCKRGHEFTPENTYLKGGSHRFCRECGRAAARAWSAKRRAPASK